MLDSQALVYLDSSSLEVNGVGKDQRPVRVWYCYICGFDSHSAVVSYDTLVIKKNANFWGYNTTGGISYDGIPWENHGYYTQVHEAGTSRLYNMEVVGTYTNLQTFIWQSTLRAWEVHDIRCKYISGTLKVGNLESTGGTFNGTFVNVIMVHSELLKQAVNQLYASVGIVTNLIVTDAALSKNYSDIGITTISHVGTQYVKKQTSLLDSQLT